MSETFPVSSHSKKCCKGSTFVAIKGLQDDGTHYIADALDHGATTVVVEYGTVLNDNLTKRLETDGTQLVFVANARKALAELSAQAAGYPSKNLKIIGITGTKGKTTTTFLCEHFLRMAGHKTALISTVHNSIGDTILETNMTTPQPDYIHQFFALCVKNNIEYVVMEVAAQAITFFRLETIVFDAIAFTNLEREHAELYPEMEQYFAAKQQLFTHIKKDGCVFINSDDTYGKRAIKACQEQNICYKTISMYEENADWFGTFAPSMQEKNAWRAIIKKREMQHCLIEADYTQFHGIFNGYNILLALALADACSSVNENAVALAFRNLPFIPGRFEVYEVGNNVRVIIDYAHTPGSFEALFKTIRPMTQHLIVVFGAGGGKDPVKRPLMGSVAAHYADHVIVTSDNPRFENVDSIVRDILVGISHDDYAKVSVIIDREQAIKCALAISQPGAYVLLLGKGPDEYQLVQGQKTFFSERSIVKSYTTLG